MIHYHGTPITPLEQLYQLAGRHFCVSYARPEQVRQAHSIGQSVMLELDAAPQWLSVSGGGEVCWCDPEVEPGIMGCTIRHQDKRYEDVMALRREMQPDDDWNDE